MPAALICVYELPSLLLRRQQPLRLRPLQQLLRPNLHLASLPPQQPRLRQLPPERPFAPLVELK